MISPEARWAVLLLLPPSNTGRGDEVQFVCLLECSMSNEGFVSRLGSTACLVCVLSCSVIWAAEEAERSVPANGEPAAVASSTIPWQNSQNHIKPLKGVRTDAVGQRIPALMWVLTSARGQPLAITDLESPKVKLYFNSRLEIKLAQVKQQYSLTTLQIEKLRLAAQVDLARLLRQAQQVNEALAAVEPGQDERGVNQLFNALGLACDLQLFEDNSLLQRVLSTQLQTVRHATSP